MAHIISCVGEKGGVGKTTLNILLATNLAARFNKSVVLLDVDDPQYSVYKKRQRELKASIGMELGRPYPIEKATTQNLVKLIAAYDQKVDYIIVDFPGRLSEEMVKGLFYVEHIFIPFSLDEFEVDSTGTFYNLLVSQFLNDQERMTTSVQVFFNQYRKVQRSRMKQLRRTIEDNNVKIMDAVVLSRTAYIEDYRSTLFGIPEGKEEDHQEFMHFIKEVITISEKDYE